MTNQRIYEEVTARVMDALEKGTVPWTKPWDARQGAPANLTTKRPYNGVNVLLLGLQPFGSRYWMTFRQAKKLGGHVRKGEHGTRIYFFQRRTVEDKDAEDGTKDIFVAKSFTVFNLEQVEDIEDPDKDAEPRPEFVPIEEAKRLLDSIQADLGLKLKHGGAHAFFSPKDDFVRVPEPDTFRSPEDYYSTCFHEAGHWTGHKSRLNRASIKDMRAFGDSNYSREELVAEMCAGFLNAATGIEATVVQENQAAYIANWLKVLKDDKRLLMTAAAQAQKAADFLQGEGPRYLSPEEAGKAASEEE